MMPLVEAPFCDEMYATCLDRVATIKDASAPVKDRIEAIQLMHGDAGAAANRGLLLRPSALDPARPPMPRPSRSRHNGAGWGDNGREAMRAGAIEALVRRTSGCQAWCHTEWLQAQLRPGVATLQPATPPASAALQVEVATDGWPQGGDLASSSCPYDEVIEVGTSTGQEEEEEEEQEYRCRHKRSMRRVAICCLTEMGNYQPLALRMAAAGLLDRGLPDMIRDSLAR